MHGMPALAVVAIILAVAKHIPHGGKAAAHLLGDIPRGNVLNIILMYDEDSSKQPQLALRDL